MGASKSRETDDNIVPLYENSNDYIGSPVRSSSPATYETYALSDNFQETSEFLHLRIDSYQIDHCYHLLPHTQSMISRMRIPAKIQWARIAHRKV